jgi:pilus assembly protein CpaE
LAAALATPERPCTLLDLNVRGGDLARLLNVSPPYSIASLSAKVEQLDAALFEQALYKHECGVHLLASPDPFGDYRLISRELVQRVVQLARHASRYVVVDLEDVEHAEQIRVLAASDRVIIPLRPDYVSLCRAKKYLDFLLRSKVTPEQVVFVANRVGQPRELPVAYMEELLGVKIVVRIPNDPLTANTAYNLGVPLVTSHPESPPAQSIRRLAALLSDEEIKTNNDRHSAEWRSRLRRWSNNVIKSVKL